MEIADEFTKLREYRSPIGKDDISNIVQEVLNEGQQKLTVCEGVGWGNKI